MMKHVLLIALALCFSAGVSADEPPTLPPSRPPVYTTFPGVSIGMDAAMRVSAELTANVIEQNWRRLLRVRHGVLSGGPVRFDACTESHTGASGSTNELSFQFSHTPSGTPRGFVVFTANLTANNAIVSGVDVGGTELVENTNASPGDSAGEPLKVQTWFLGENVPTGEQTITVDRPNNNNVLYAVACTVTADGDTEIYEPGIVLLEDDGAASEQSVNDGSPSGGSSQRFAFAATGLDTLSTLAAGANSTQIQAIDTGSVGAKLVYEAVSGIGARSVGFDSGASSDDRAIVHLAIRQVPTSGGGGDPGAGGGGGGGATVVADSCSQADIMTAIGSVDAEGTVEVPEGSCVWTGQLTSTGKSFRLVGQGTGPVITDANESDARVMRFDCPAGTAPESFFEWSNFTVNEGLTTNRNNRPFLLINDCEAFRVHDITIDGYEGNKRSEWAHVDNSYGVFFDINFTNAGNTNWLLVGHTSFGGVGAFGDNSWAQPTNWGSSQAVFVEDSLFQNVATSGSGFQLVEANGEGARYVFRFNDIRQFYLGGHGTESPGRQRSVRSVRAYNNAWTVNASPATLDRTQQIRGGTILHFNNTITRTGGGSGFFNSWVRLWQARLADSLGGWGYCDGTGAYDNNDTTGGPGADGIYVTGTATAGTTTDSLVDSTKNFATACGGGSCVGYSLRDLDLGRSSLILSASGDTITTRATNFNAPHSYVSGNSYEIRRVIRCIDHVASGQGDLLSGSPATPTGSVDNVSDPAYVFGNTGGTPSFGYVSDLARLTENTDYFIHNASFDGTAGVGTGLRSARPATCTTGVAYWATDGGGSWNSANGAGADGGLDKCVSTDTWDDDWYVPAAYPHPYQTTFPPES